MVTHGKELSRDDFEAVPKGSDIGSACSKKTFWLGLGLEHSLGVVSKMETDFLDCWVSSGILR